MRSSQGCGFLLCLMSGCRGTACICQAQPAAHFMTIIRTSNGLRLQGAYSKDPIPGLVSFLMILKASMKDPGQPCEKMSGMAFGSEERSCTKWSCKCRHPLLRQVSLPQGGTKFWRHATFHLGVDCPTAISGD